MNEAASASSILTGEDHAALARAVDALERVTLATRLTSLMGRQLAFAGQVIPERARAAASRAATLALRGAMHVVLRSLGTGPRPARRGLHRAAVIAAGAAGGAFGLASLPLELPASTVLMLRAIADVARAEGEDLHDPEAALACLEVFALGGRAPDDDHMNGGYFAVRGLLAQSITEASRFILERGVADEGAPVLVRFLVQVAARFGFVVSQKLAAQAVPVIGAVGGAAVNYAFIAHFQDVAHGHFTVRRLERRYGASLIQQEYERLRESGVTAQPRPAAA